MEIEPIRQAARGNWLTVLSDICPSLTNAVIQKGKHTSCPVHGGKDGFRLFKDAQETGGGVCNSCGCFFDGFELLKFVTGLSFIEVVKLVDEHLRATSNISFNGFNKIRIDDVAKQATKRKQEREKSLAMQRLFLLRWNNTIPINQSCVNYLQKRNIILTDEQLLQISDSLHYVPEMAYYDDGKLLGKYPAILGKLTNKSNQFITFHRIYLDKNFEGKAKVSNPKKLMGIGNGYKISGSCIRLGNPTAQGVIGIAEGIETALAVYSGCGLACWSATNANMMAAFEPPQGITAVIIWADKDANAVGEKAAIALQNKLQKKDIATKILLPNMEILDNGKSIDWNDVLISQGVDGFPRRIKVSNGINNSSMNQTLVGVYHPQR